MSFESWVKNSWLERLDSDAAEIARLLGLADVVSRITRERLLANCLLMFS
jgi:hypothetical protein